MAHLQSPHAVTFHKLYFSNCVEFGDEFFKVSSRLHRELAPRREVGA
jgi:hypothetical protein